MERLHENRAEFLSAINYTADYFGISRNAVEKDYYVTMILRGLAESLDFVVFKGGTSLSK
jgi:predicted nucleotidyltransferase component of viral defense system